MLASMTVCTLGKPSQANQDVCSCGLDQRKWRHLLRSAPHLRQTNKSAGQQMYINPDLSPQEAKLTYEERELRRERKLRQQATDPVYLNTLNTDPTKVLSDVCEPPTVSMAADTASVLGINEDASTSNGPSIPLRL